MTNYEGNKEWEIEDVINARKAIGQYNVKYRSDDLLRIGQILQNDEFPIVSSVRSGTYRRPIERRRREVIGIRSEGSLDLDDTDNVGSCRRSQVAMMMESDLNSWPSDSDITVLRVKMKGKKFRLQMRKEWEKIRDEKCVPGDGAHHGENSSLVNLATLISTTSEAQRKDEDSEYLLPLTSWYPHLSLQEVSSEPNIDYSSSRDITLLKTRARFSPGLSSHEFSSQVDVSSASMSSNVQVSKIYSGEERIHHLSDCNIRISSSMIELRRHQSYTPRIPIESILDLPERVYEREDCNFNLEFLLRPTSQKQKRLELIRKFLLKYFCPCLSLQRKAKKSAKQKDVH